MNLVSESLNELYKFEKKSDPYTSLGIGQKYLITKWLDEMDVKKYIINDNLTIDVNGYLNLYNRNLIRLPDYIKFGKVSINFTCHYNNLISLEGCPIEVNGDFWCMHNKKQFTKEDVRKVCKVKGEIYV
jgi:hypothetical protein